MSGRLTRRTWVTLGILLLAIPALMAVFVCVWDERKYYLTSLLLVGLMFAGFAILGALDRSNRKRFGNAAFWSLLALSMLAGQWLGDFNNGLLVLALSGLALGMLPALIVFVVALFVGFGAQIWFIVGLRGPRKGA